MCSQLDDPSAHEGTPAPDPRIVRLERMTNLRAELVEAPSILVGVRSSSTVSVRELDPVERAIVIASIDVAARDLYARIVR